MKNYVERFFDELQVFEDVERGHCYKIFMKQSILAFLENETKENAFAVYRTFFDSYRIVLHGASNPFIDLLDMLKQYEENAAVLIDKQRDHYIHSVNVFILGLCIYVQNQKYQTAFRCTVMNKQDYPFSYDTNNEEFFYRWGLASLFHDVGYPVEIVGRQINQFVDFATGVGGKGENVNVQLVFSNFAALNQIVEVVPKREFTKAYFDHFQDSIYIDTLKPIDLLAHKLHTTLQVDLPSIKSALDDFGKVMARFGFIDHGYYSSIIVLKWYGYLIQSAGYKSEYFFWPVLDSASAILLHNCYKNMMQKKPFNLGPLLVATHPIAYLLILCDELQEWNRLAYGKKDKLRTLAAKAKIEITNEELNIRYITYNTSLPSDFSREKKKLLYTLLSLSDLFDALSIRCQVVNKSSLPMQRPSIDARPMLNDLEKLARAIHELYNQKQVERYPDKKLKYPSFDELPESLKYSNLRQAMAVTEKLKQMGYRMQPLEDPGAAIERIPLEFVEELARAEHEEWTSERRLTGWTLGAAVDSEKKTTPYLVDYEKLPESIKQLDRDAVENIPALLRKIDKAVVLL